MNQQPTNYQLQYTNQEGKTPNRIWASALPWQQDLWGYFLLEFYYVFSGPDIHEDQILLLHNSYEQ